jgi:serine/threonine protein kinase
MAFLVMEYLSLPTLD